jgi:hypothetical protein
MKKGDKAQQSTTSVEKADNTSIQSQPTIQQKTEQGEAETYTREPGHEYEGSNKLPPKKPGEKTTTGVNKV